MPDIEPFVVESDAYPALDDIIGLAAAVAQPERLPILHVDGGETAVVNPDTGDLELLHDASDRTLAHAAAKLAAHDAEVFGFKRAIAFEMRERHGVGTAHAGGYAFKVAESQSWPAGATNEALDALVAEGRITAADADRCRSAKPRPDATQLKALVGRLTAKDPVAAKRLADACTVSPPSLSDVRAEAVDAACEVCGAGPTGRCDPPDEYDGDCPHDCSPER